MSGDLRERLAQGVVLLDGAMGSALMALGLETGECTASWNLSHPEEVARVHAGFLEAGCQVIQTNTFAGNTLALAESGLEDRVEEVNRRGAEIARETVESMGSSALVAGNIGPTGKFLPPVGEAVPELLEAAFVGQVKALVAGGVDYLAIETMLDLEEARLALRVARSVTDLPVTVCLTFERKPRGVFTLMGNRPRDCVQILAEEGACAVGANCSVGSSTMREFAEEFLVGAPVPIIFKPNAGLPDCVDGRPVYRQDAEDFAADVTALAQMGARAVGGCCGTEPRHLRVLRGLLERPS